MQIIDTYKDSILQANNLTIVNNNILKKLLENCFSVLAGYPEMHNVNTLTNSKIDVIKQVYAGLLYLCTEFTRQNQTKENVKQFLTETCNFNEARAEIFAEMYRQNKQGVEISLLNIGNHIQHVIDVKWKIDYIVKSNNIDQFSGPLFRVSIITESNNQVKKVNEINFVCNRQELQDLVYKLKDASKHCNKLTTDN